MAQRMESAAPPGGVMLSESTARLVEHTAVLAEPEWVRIKGSDEPVRARRLVRSRRGVPRSERTEPRLVGRSREMAALEAMVEGAVNGRGGVVGLVGSPGIGKSPDGPRDRGAGRRSRGRGGVDLLRVACA